SAPRRRSPRASANEGGAGAPAAAGRPKPKPAASLAVATVELGQDGEAAFGALRAWRAERSKRDKVPAYVVLPDTHTRAAAAARPATIEQLARLPGIGPRKLELYGDDILAVLAGLS